MLEFFFLENYIMLEFDGSFAIHLVTSPDIQILICTADYTINQGFASQKCSQAAIQKCPSHFEAPQPTTPAETPLQTYENGNRNNQYSNLALTVWTK
jgi:hypothetical protein